MDPDSHDDPRYAVGNRPVNRRTAARLAGLPPQDATPVTQRGVQLQRRYAAGASLRSLAERPPPLATLRKRTLALVLAGTGALSSALFAPLWLSLPAAGLLFGAAWWSARSRAAEASATVPTVSSDELAALDALIERTLPQLVEPLQQALLGLKQDLAQVLAGPIEQAQDRLYLRETVRRYLPDSLQAYVQVPAAQRAQPLGDGAPSADEALRQQFALLGSALEKLNARLGAQAGEALLRQQRFLEAKSRD